MQANPTHINNDAVFSFMERLQCTCDLLAFFKKFPGIHSLSLLYGWGYTDDQFICRPSMLQIGFDDSATHERYLLQWFQEISAQREEQPIIENKGNNEETIRSFPMIRASINYQLSEFFAPLEDLADPQQTWDAEYPDNDARSPLGRRCGCCYTYRRPENLEQLARSFAALVKDIEALITKHLLPRIEKFEIESEDAGDDSEYEYRFPEACAIAPILERLQFLDDTRSFFELYPGVKMVKVQYRWVSNDGYIHTPYIARIEFEDPMLRHEYLLAWDKSLSGEAEQEPRPELDEATGEDVESIHDEIVNNALTPFFKSTNEVLSDLNDPPGKYSVFQLGRVAGNCYVYRCPENIRSFQDSLIALIEESHATLDGYSVPPLETMAVDPYSDLWNSFY